MSDEARYAQVLRFPNRRELARRFPPLVAGLLIIGFSIAISVRARLGLAPWDVLHQGIAKTANLSIGVVLVLVGLVVLLAWIPLRQHFGLGTILNTLSIGFIANLGLALIPEQHALAARAGFLALAIFGWSVARGRTSYALQPLALAVVLVALAANAIGPAAFVARANIARVLDPSGLPADASRDFDADTLVGLGGGAIAELVDAFPRLPLSQRLYADILLRIALSRVDEDRVPDWQGWNFERERARAALVRARDELLR